MTLAGWILLALGAVGLLGGNLRFIRNTLPETHGVNPGYGAYEMELLPGWIVTCIAIGLLVKPWVGAALLLPGIIAFGFLGHAVARWFGPK